MTDKHLVVVGAGPGLGLSVAHRFGREGLSASLIARNPEKLDALVRELRHDGIEAAGFPADAADESQLKAALAAAKARFGPVDVLEHSPASRPADPRVLTATGMTREVAGTLLQAVALGAVTSVGEVLPEMIARKSGTILITTGLSAVTPVPFLAAVGMSGAAVRNYALNLNVALAPLGVYAASVCLGVIIRKGDPVSDPDRLAETYFELWRDRDRAEVTVMAGDAAPIVELEDLLNQGATP